MRHEQVILHLDMDAFFASCEQANNPNLKNKPVVVSRYDDHSIITAASYECRAYGVRAAMPIFKVKQLLKGVDFFIVGSEYDLYEKYSQKIFALIKTNFTHKIEVVGLDECFIDASDIWAKYGNVHNLCLAIQALIYQDTTLTCSIGASFNKMFAKMGSDMNKPNGVKIITKQNFKTIIWPLPIENVIGVGISFKNIADQFSIKSINDFINQDNLTIVNLFGKVGLKMKNALLGENNSKVDYLTSRIKSISKEKSLTSRQKLNIFDEEIKSLIFDLTQNVVYRLKHIECKAKTINFSIKFFTDKKSQNSRKNYSKSLEYYTDDFEIIYSLIETIFNEINTQKIVTLVSCGVSNLIENKKNFNQSQIEF